MTQPLHERFESLIGRTLTDESGHKIGKVEDIYTDDDTGQPEWLAVVTGHFGSNVSFVPLAGASSSGDDLQVPFPKDQVKDAPNADSDGKLSEDEEARLYAHYGLDYDQERVRLQRWVDREGTAGSPTAYSARADGEQITDDEMRRRPDDAHVSSRPAPSWADEEELDREHGPMTDTRSEPLGAPVRRS